MARWEPATVARYTRRVDPSPPAFVIGDVHGCVDELRALLLELRHHGLHRDSQIVFVGDLLDRGPEPVAVVRFVRGLAEAGQPVVLCLGNHEERHARFRRQWEEHGQASLDDPQSELRRTTDALSSADREFLEGAVLFHRLPWAEVLVVHAGVPPDLVELPDLDALGSLSSRARSRLLRMVRLRYWNRDAKAGAGAFVAWGDERPGRDVHWAEIYDGRFGHVLFGHTAWPRPEPMNFPHATGIDLGCVYGGRLAAAVVRGPGDIDFASVPAERVYSVPVGSYLNDGG